MTKTIFYSFKEEYFIVSSHSTLAARIFNLDENLAAQDILNSKKFTGRKYLPGLMTPFKGLLPLTPNNYLDIKTQKCFRFFPRKPIIKNNDIHNLIINICQILKNQAMILTEYPNIRVSLTSGFDSRITFASFKFLNTKNIVFFTHINKGDRNSYLEDVNIATKLCNLMKYEHQIIEYGVKDIKNFDEYKKVWLANVGMHRGSVHLFKAYTDTFPENTLHIRSNIAEIARSFYKKNDKLISAKNLSAMYTSSNIKKNPVVINHFQEFIEKSNFKEEFLFNYDYEDLFYWEHRMPIWHSWIVNEGDTAFETFVPFNNRKLLQMMLSTDRDLRDKDILFAKILEKLDPSLIKIPINNKFININ